MDLKKYLYIKHLSVEEFARMLGIHRMTLSRCMSRGKYSERIATRIEHHTNGEVTKQELEKK